MEAENKIRVLVIDDNVDIHQDIRKILTPVKDPSHKRLDEMNALLLDKSTEKKKMAPTFEVDSAYQGQEGVTLVQKAISEGKPYAIAFVDVQMPPGEDGVVAIGHIWQLDPNIQTVICTAYAKYSWNDLMKIFGNTDRLFILKKPFDDIEITQLASSLSIKWGLTKTINKQISNIKKPDNGDISKSMSTMKETVRAFAEINEKLKNKN